MTVSNVAPVIDSAAVTYNQVTGDVFSTVTYHDQGVPDTETVTFQYKVTNGGTTTYTHTAGPGLPSAGTSQDTLHLDPGCYTIETKIWVTDDDGGSSTPYLQTLGPNLDFYDASFRPPIKEDERNIAKYGNVVPVKVILTSMCVPGTNVTTPRLFITIALGNMAPDADPDDPNVVVESVSNADSGNEMRRADSMYIYNLSTRPLQAGKDYTIRIREGSPAARSY